MDENAITVHVVSASSPKAERDVEGRRARVELGKFFARSAADEHAAGLNPQHWIEVRVESRQEWKHEQHFTHGGMVGR